MSEYIKAPDWPDDAKTTENGKYNEERTITVVFCDNLMRTGGYYVVFQGEENVFEGDFYRAKKVAIDVQRDTGRPIEENVVPI